MTVRVTDGTLRISAEREAAVDEREANYVRRERTHTRLERSVSLPGPVDADRARTVDVE